MQIPLASKKYTFACPKHLHTFPGQVFFFINPYLSLEGGIRMLQALVTLYSKVHKKVSILE